MKLSLLPALLASTVVAALADQPRRPVPHYAGEQQRVIGAATATAPPQYRSDLLDLHKSLVEIESVTLNELEVARFLVDYLGRRGFHAALQEIPQSYTPSDKPRFNVVARPHARSSSSADDAHHLPGWTTRPRVLVTSHIDTVPPFIPYSTNASTVAAPAVGSDTVIAGRGSVDAKGSVAAQVTAVLDLMSSSAAATFPADDLLLLYVVGEESLGDGMRYFSDSLNSTNPAADAIEWSRPPHGRFDAAIFGEPTENKLACGHKGGVACTVKAHGKAGHSGYPALGKSATEAMMRALVRVLDTDLGSSERFGNTTVNVGLIQGGVAANVIPAEAEARLMIRVAVAPQEEGAKVVLRKLDDVIRSVDAEIELDCGYGGYGAVVCDCDVDGFDTFIANYGTDVPNLEAEYAQARYLYGPGTIFVAHADNEAIQLKDLEASVEGFKKLILHALDH